MKYNSNALTNQIYDILAPLVGEMMAAASIELQTKKIGVKPDSITRNDLPGIADEIRKGLVVFLGSAGAEKISARIKNLQG